MNYCRDCKFWEREPIIYTIEETHKLGHCKKADLEYPDTLAMALGYENGTLVTAPNFGCVQFEDL